MQLESTNNAFLANLIMIFHILVIIFMILAPFSNSSSFLILHIVFSFSLLIHWYANNNLCSLTLLEGKLRGVDYQNGFIHQFISPVYSMQNTEWNNICYSLTIILLSISIYRLYKSKKIDEFLDCYKRTKNTIKNDDNLNRLPLHKKFAMYFSCLEVFNGI